MLRSYIRWLRNKRRTPYRNTPLLGNPHEVVGHAPPPGRSNSAFSRASFGKYERQKRRRKRIAFFLMLLLLAGLAWVAWESMGAFSVFEQ